jgi:glycosyltransferase involved in cell wall biosynthesis
MAPEKNIDLAIAAFRRLRLVQPKAVMVITGDGPERKRLAKEHTDVIIAPAQTPEGVARFYASADLFLFPSMSETYGNVAAEAMASGLPTLAFDYAAPRKLICDGRDGFLVPFGDVPGFADRACQIVRDLSALRQVGSSARQVAEKHGWDAVLDRFEAILVAAASRQPLPDFEPLPGPGSPHRNAPALAVATSSHG